MKATTIMAAMFVAGAMARGEINEVSALDVALNKGDWKAATALIQKASDFDLWARTLVFEGYQHMPKGLLRAALLNPRIWIEPDHVLEAGETAAARDTTGNALSQP